MAAYYNENKPEAAHMLRQLIKDGLIAAGDVDERSITEVSPDDVRGYKQCHFFAGIGGWDIALQLAGWPVDKEIWTGSCPCQPFSVAGRRKGTTDERHLWPTWFNLIRECRPATIFGEQVARAAAVGWLDGIADDLEREDYAFAACVLPACSVGAPHRRDRLWFVANTSVERRDVGGDIGQERYLPCDKNGDAAQGQSKWQRRECGISEAIETSSTASDTNNIGCEGGKCQEIFGQPILPWESERSFENFNNGWRISAPKICSVDDGLHGRTPILHALGNAIVPACAQAFIESTKGIVW